jgi:hypothetical protein
LAKGRFRKRLADDQQTKALIMIIFTNVLLDSGIHLKRDVHRAPGWQGRTMLTIPMVTPRLARLGSAG